MSITARIQKWRKYRRTFNALYGLSNRQLTDMGISRRDIASTAERVS